jgi:hypothetical protein
VRRGTRIDPFRADVALAVASALLCALTLVVPDWIEVVLRVDPDAGSGALEWAVAIAFAAAAARFGLAARRRWRLAAS